MEDKTIEQRLAAVELYLETLPDQLIELGHAIFRLGGVVNIPKHNNPDAVEEPTPDLPGRADTKE
jgi:hypothetical protein